jgi:hypothetical protein
VVDRGTWKHLLTTACQHNLLTVEDNESARLLTYASSALEAVGLSSQSPFPPSVLSGWAEEELRALRSEKRPLLAHMTGEYTFAYTSTYRRRRRRRHRRLAPRR